LPLRPYLRCRTALYPLLPPFSRRLPLIAPRSTFLLIAPRRKVSQRSDDHCNRDPRDCEQSLRRVLPQGGYVAYVLNRRALPGLLPPCATPPRNIRADEPRRRSLAAPRAHSSCRGFP